MYSAMACINRSFLWNVHLLNIQKETFFFTALYDTRNMKKRFKKRQYINIKKTYPVKITTTIFPETEA